MLYTNFERYDSIYQLFQKKYRFKLGEIKDYQLIMDFIEKHWNKEHIFLKSKDLFDWQHLDKKNNRYNFVLAINKQNEDIVGLLGFIMSSIYDNEIKSPIRWGAIWKVREDTAMKGLGVCLKYYLEKNVPVSYVAGLGLSEDSKLINGKLGEEVGKLKAYYMLNEEKTIFRLAGQVTDLDYSVNSPRSNKKIREIQFDDLCGSRKKYHNLIPEFKSPMYYLNRYGKHPVYKYRIYEIIDGENEKACFIMRQCEAEGAKAFTIVDYIGDGTELIGTYREFQRILKKSDCEYISFYQLGLIEEGLNKSGFRRRNDSNIVIPLYFEPIVKKNVDLDYHFITDQNNVSPLIFKGDSDQDRPNYLP